MTPEEYIQELVNRLQLPPDSVLYAKKFFDKALTDGINRDHSKAAIACACLYIYCQHHNISKVLYEFESASFIESESIVSALGDMQFAVKEKF
ncbi:hypothetical protein GOV04_03390 [Candidatus Woesearchaeota archaeon]|nr:hypothetical protein [Candidatus Woesearchaeota archaeon]